MKAFLIFIAATCYLLTAPDVLAKKKHGSSPDFQNYEWSEIRETDFLDVDHWEPRAGLQAVELKGRLYILGGRTPSPSFIPFDSIIHGDVWVSDDGGENWTEILEDAEAAGMWRKRAYFEAITTKKHIYILGGQNFIQIPNDCTDWVAPFPCPPFLSVSEFFNDVWRSKDGVKWKKMTDDAPWAGRAGLGAASFRGKLFVMAGSQNDDEDISGMGRIFFNDVWSSKDGRKWRRETANAPWEPRAGGVVLEKDGYLYVMGGEKGFIDSADYFNDVWRSKKGKKWQLVTDNAGWSPRPGHKCSVVNDYFVCMGGYDSPANPSDIWVSSDGAEWTQVSDTPWNNDPDQPIYFPPGYAGCSNSPPLRCDNVRYDFDMLTVGGSRTGRRSGHGQSILTFGGDRERFELDPVTNFFRVDNDVWRWAPER